MFNILCSLVLLWFPAKAWMKNFVFHWGQLSLCCPRRFSFIQHIVVLHGLVESQLDYRRNLEDVSLVIVLTSSGGVETIYAAAEWKG